MHLKTTPVASWAGIETVRRLRDSLVGLQPTGVFTTTFSQVLWNILSIILCLLCLKRWIQIKNEGKSATCCGTSNIPSSTQVREKFRSSNRTSCLTVNNSYRTEVINTCKCHYCGGTFLIKLKRCFYCIFLEILDMGIIFYYTFVLCYFFYFGRQAKKPFWCGIYVVWHALCMFLCFDPSLPFCCHKTIVRI